MSQYEYKVLTYSLEGKVLYSLRYWADTSGKPYGQKKRARLLGGVAHQMIQLEEALKELGNDGWDLVSVSVWTAFPFTRLGVAVVRRPIASPQGK